MGVASSCSSAPDSTYWSNYGNNCFILSQLFYILSSTYRAILVIRELKQQRRQRQQKRHLKTNIWEMVTILLLLRLRRIPYF